MNNIHFLLITELWTLINDSYFEYEYQFNVIIVIDSFYQHKMPEKY